MSDDEKKTTTPEAAPAEAKVAEGEAPAADASAEKAQVAADAAAEAASTEPAAAAAAADDAAAGATDDDAAGERADAAGDEKKEEAAGDADDAKAGGDDTTATDAAAAAAADSGEEKKEGGADGAAEKKEESGSAAKKDAAAADDDDDDGAANAAAAAAAAGGGGVLQSGFFELKGRRPTMEDAHAVIPDMAAVAELAGAGEGVSGAFFAVFDGHGGQETAKYCAEEVPKAFAGSAKRAAGDVEGAFEEVFREVDERVVAKMVAEGWADGSTGAVAWVDTAGGKIHQANVGDSEVLVISENEAGDGVSHTVLSWKHKPSQPEEKKRIEEAGGHVVFGRVLGNLAVARAFGDKDFKHPHNAGTADFVSNQPFYKQYDIQPKDRILLVACDGMFERLDYDQVAEAVWERFQAKDDPTAIAKFAVNEAFSSGSRDNISAVCCFLP